MHWFAFQATLVMACTLVFGGAAHAETPDGEVRARLIRDSIASYPGNCPCPYNLDRAGRRCGARSAYSKPGGRAPLCFAEDVTKEMIAAYRSGP